MFPMKKSTNHVGLAVPPKKLSLQIWAVHQKSLRNSKIQMINFRSPGGVITWPYVGLRGHMAILPPYLKLKVETGSILWCH
jgi:hypothetical protein